MVRSAYLLLLLAIVCSAESRATESRAAQSPVDIDTAADVYQAAQVRAQVRASLGSMPLKIRQMFASDRSAALSEQHLDAVTAAAKHAFQITIFEPPALNAFANNLDAATVKKSLAFLGSDVGQRMVAADVALAQADEAKIDAIMSGEIGATSTPEREALTRQLEQDTQSTESAVAVYLKIGKALAVGTAIGSGMDPKAAAEQAEHAANALARENLANNLREPLRRYIAYGYRDLSDADLKQLTAFLESVAGKRFVTAYNAAMDAGYDAMSQRCGEQIGESWRELAQAEASAPEMLAAPPAVPPGAGAPPAGPAPPAAVPPNPAPAH
ncbi:MAG: DUF2059 domain-containing protein [Steroidobacteraceae bacterium]|jgi:hypothetical protein